MDYVIELEKALGITAKKNFIEIQEGELVETSSDINLLQTLTGFKPKKTLAEGILEFVNWYKEYYSISS